MLQLSPPQLRLLAAAWRRFYQQMQQLEGEREGWCGVLRALRDVHVSAAPGQGPQQQQQQRRGDSEQAFPPGGSSAAVGDEQGERGVDAGEDGGSGSDRESDSGSQTTGAEAGGGGAAGPGAQPCQTEAESAAGEGMEEYAASAAVASPRDGGERGSGGGERGGGRRRRGRQYGAGPGMLELAEAGHKVS